MVNACTVTGVIRICATKSEFVHVFDRKGDSAADKGRFLRESCL